MKTNALMLRYKNIDVLELSDRRLNIITPEFTPPYVAENPDYYGLVGWLRMRQTKAERTYGKKIEIVLASEHGDGDYAVIANAVKFHSLCVGDNYWVKSSDSRIDFESVNVRKNALSEKVRIAALSGITDGFVETITPEITTQGTLAKAWQNINGELFLCRCSDVHSLDNELSAVQIAKTLGISVVEYKRATIDGQVCNVCPNIATNEYDFINASWVSSSHEKIIATAERLNQKLFAQMQVLDYLAANPDRHLDNWGFLMNTNTGVLENVAPLFDFDNAFSSAVLTENDAPSRVFSMSDKLLSEVAKEYFYKSGLSIGTVKQAVQIISDKVKADWYNHAVENLL